MYEYIMQIRFFVLALMLIGLPLPAAERKILQGHVPLKEARSRPLAPLPGSQNLELALTLPLRNTEALTNLLQQLYDPASPLYRKYLTPEQFTERFGPTERDYQKVITFARSHGLTVSGTHPNRAVLDVRGPVAKMEEAFQMRMWTYRHPSESRTFFSPDAEPSVDPDLPIEAISGLNNFVLPHPMNLKRAPLPQPATPAPAFSTRSVHPGNAEPPEVRSYATGSGPGGNFIGNDFRAAYAPGITNDGAGQAIALFEFGPFSPNSIYVYQTNANLSTNIVITIIPVNGFNTNWTGQDDGEECLDIEMAMSMAPGATILVYEGNNGTDIFNRIANDNLAKQISCSFGWSPFDASLANTFKQFAAQGQSCYIASGDSGAEVGSIFPPGDDPYLTIVGGTSLTTSGGGGPWQSETAWVGSSGGVSTKFGIPSWQQGINMQLNQGSTTMRNVPDVAMISDTVLFFVYKNGTTGTIGGTSAAAPLWAGFTALANQQAVAQGKPPAGFINPAVYALGKGSYSTYSSCFHDITSGNNFNSSSPTKYAATSGYDLCTGWGTPKGLATINFLAGTGTNDFTLYPSAAGLTITPGGNAATILSIFPLAGFSGSVSLSCTGLPRGVTATLTPSATASTSLLTLTSTTNAAIGTFSVPVTATAGNLSHSLTIFLTVSQPIPGAAQVNLASAYNRAGIYTDGTSFSGGLDNDGYAYSANLLGTAPSLNGVQFTLGPANVLDAVRGTGQTITLPAGQFTTLQMLGAAVNGNQNNQVFTVTYTDNSTATFSQSLSDWAAPQNYAGESTVIRMPYRNSGNGTKDIGTAVSLYKYSLTLDQTKTVKSVTLPNNGNVVLLALTLVNGPASASLAAYYNRAGMYTDGTTFTNPPTGGIDGGGAAYSATVLGYAQTWSNVLFNFGPANATNVISAAGQTVTLPPGNYSALRMLATGVQGNQTSQPFTVTYADATTSTFSQSLSDWFTPQNFSGESRAVITGHRNNSNGSKDNRTFYLYGYSFKLNSSKVLQSLRLPNNGNVIVTSVSLIPNWQPTFLVSPFLEPGLVAGQPFSGTLATNATDLNGDSLSFAKVSGPAWLTVAPNGALSGMPLSPDAGTNIFVVQATDPGGLSATATMMITVTPAPPIIASMSLQDSNLLLSWSGGIGPYQVLMTTDLVNSAWIPVGSPITANSLLLSPTNASAFYRLSGQ
jgi:hypothetical protein